jgi:hypothetical protein
MLRSSTLAFLLAIAAAPSCSDLPDVIEPKPGAAGSAAGAGAAGKAGASGAAGAAGAAAGKGGSGDDKRDAGSDEDAST